MPRQTRFEEIVGQLKGPIERYAIDRSKEWRLNSGSVSGYYCNLKPLTLSPPHVRMMAKLMLPFIVDSGAQGVGGLETGAIPLADAIGNVSIQTPDLLSVFFVRKEEKSHGVPDRINAGLTNFQPLIRPGRMLAVVEDVVTNGGAALEAVRVVQAAGCKVSLVMAVIERHEGGGEQFSQMGIPFKRLFYTDKEGNLYLDEEVKRRFAD